jgi:hypothetical protein
MKLLCDLIHEAFIIFLSYQFFGYFGPIVLGLLFYPMLRSLTGYVLIYFFGYLRASILCVIRIIRLSLNYIGNFQTSNDTQVTESIENACTNTTGKFDGFMTPEFLKPFTVSDMRSAAKKKGLTKLGRTKD